MAKNYGAAIAMHTAEHILNSRMVAIYNCSRCYSSHIEKKKSKCDYHFDHALTEDEILRIEQEVNTIITKQIPITSFICKIDEIPNEVDLSRLPTQDIEELRLVRIGDFDLCACIGEHVQNTSEIGIFKIISCDYVDNNLRIRFKTIATENL